jgi:uncharacterized protein YdeI (BOF family)
MKHVLILLSLAMSTTICVAQDDPSANVNSQSNVSQSPASNAQAPGPGHQGRSAAGQSTGTSSSTSNSAPQTISGCLNQSGAAYTLTDSQTGTVYKLTGNTKALSPYVGHEMQITGQANEQGNADPTGAPSANSGRPFLFQVSIAKHLADQCGPSSATANGPSL